MRECWSTYALADTARTDFVRIVLEALLRVAFVDPSLKESDPLVRPRAVI
jgi:hypothetical protein